jgi:hypothetical protein
MSCGAKYAIPDERVARAGATGLRVRCTRCRAIMGVSSSAPPSSAQASSSPASSSPREPHARRDDGVHRPLTTGVWKNPFADVAAPATLAASGDLQRAAGVTREVTGVFSGILASVEAPALTPSSSTKPGARAWFCAIDGRARGPYSADEMLALAHKGNVRTSTLIWRPGAAGWKPLRAVDAFDVAWLLDAARQRRQAEQRAEQDMLRRRGIVPVRLERRTVRATATTATSAAPAADGLAAAAIGSLADASFDDDVGPSALPVVGALHDLDDAASSPFVWRAPSTASHAAQKRPSRAHVALALAGLGATAALVVAGVASLVGGGAIHLP